MKIELPVKVEDNIKAGGRLEIYRPLPLSHYCAVMNFSDVMISGSNSRTISGALNNLDYALKRTTR